MRKIITFITFILLGFLAFSQNTSPLVVKSFTLQANGIMDIEQVPRDARTDWDNNPVCMIMVKADGFDENLMQTFTFVPNGIDIMHKTMREGMVLLYVSSNKLGEINIKHLGDCVFKLPNKLEGHKLYVLTLGMEKATLIIKAIPAEAEIFVDNQKVGTGEARCPVSIGDEHRYKVTCDLYYTQEGSVKIDRREEKTVTVELASNFGYVSITTEPSGADVYIDDQKVGKTPYQMKKLVFGTHVVEIKKLGYDNHAEVIDIRKGEVNRQLENVELTALDVAYGILSVTSEPNGAEIKVDGEYIGRTPQTLEALVGDHTIDIWKKGYVHDTRTFSVFENMTTDAHIFMKSGKEIMIKSNGEGDKVFIDNEYYGDTPLAVYLEDGDYNVKVVRGDETRAGKFSVSPTMASNIWKFKFAVGAGNGVFSVSMSKKVVIAPGNLQYQASTNTWRFAENQWEIAKDDNNKRSATYDGWIDLFGWGTSGYDGKQPYMTSTNDLDYGNGPEFNINGTNYDWGVYNTIANSDERGWRTPVMQEWAYLLIQRQTESGILFARAVVNGVCGLIILPDDWKSSYYTLKDVNVRDIPGNSVDTSYYHNIISLEDWTNKLEVNGAVFLPTGGQYGHGEDISKDRKYKDYYGYVPVGGCYWASTKTYKIKGNKYGCNAVVFEANYIYASFGVSRRYIGCSVRLFRDVE